MKIKGKKKSCIPGKNSPGTRNCQCLSALGYICIGKKFFLVPAQSKLISPPRLICLAFPSKQMLTARYSEYSLIKIDPLAVVAPQGSILSESNGSSPETTKEFTPLPPPAAPAWITLIYVHADTVNSLLNYFNNPPVAKNTSAAIPPAQVLFS